MENLEYTYKGELWTQALTVPDENSFFHSAFGTNADEVYFDKHAKVKRLQWAAFLTYYQNEAKPPSLVETLKKCLLAHEQYKDISLEDNDQFEKYISGITATETPVTLEEIPILATLENVKVVVLLDKKGESTVVIEPNPALLGEYKICLQKPREVVMSFEDQTFSRLEPVIQPPPPKLEKEVDEIQNLFKMLQTGTNSNEPKHVAVVKLVNLLVSSSQGVFLDKMNPYGDPERNKTLLDEFDQCLTYLQTLAIKFIFEPNQWKLFLTYRDEADETLEKNVLSLSLVEKLGSKYCFVNKVFAEYFLGQSLLKEFQVNNDRVEFQRLVFEEILSKPEYVMTRAFFNKFLQDAGHSLPTNIFQNYLSYKGEGAPQHSSQLFYLLCCEDCIEIVRFILKCLEFQPVSGKVVELNSVPVDLRGNTLSVLQYLLRHGGVNMKDSSGIAPIHTTVKAGNTEAVKFLVQQGADVNCKDDTGLTALHLASMKNLSLVKVLLEFGADINVPDTFLNTPLHRAAENGTADIVRFLVENGANINALDEQGFAPMHSAAIRGRWDITKSLVELGAVFRTAGSKGDILVNLYASRGQLDLVRYLAGLNADLNVLDDLGDSCLSLAVVSNRFDTVKCLVELGADVNGRARGGLTPFLLSLIYGSLELTTYLVEHGADIEASDRKECRGLHIAASSGNLDTVKYLAAAGVDLNSKTNDGDTALHWAATRGHGEVAKFLIDKGAEANVRNYAGRTALQVAEAAGKTDLVALLRELGCV